MESQGQGQTADLQRTEAQHQRDLFNIGSPGFRIALSDFLKDLGQPGGEPDSVKKAFDQMRMQTGQQFDTAAKALPGTINAQMTSSGYRGDPNAGSSAAEQALFSLEQQRQGQLGLLTQQENDMSLSQRDFDLSQILGLGAGGFQSSLGFSQNALRAAGYNQGNPLGGALSGAVSGATAGSVIPGWGTAVGAIVGGVGGYFSSRGRG